MPPPPTPEVAAPEPRLRLLSPRGLLAASVLIGLLAVSLNSRWLLLLGLPDFGFWFLDSYAILAANDAVQAGLNPYDDIPFDVLKRPHVYSDWWLGLRWLGLTRADNFVFGGACVAAFLAVALAGVRPRTYAQAAGLAVLFLSPPLLLALNRANNDLVIFVVIGAPLLWLHRESAPWKIIGLAAGLVVGTGLKYYPIVGIAALALTERPVRRTFWITGITLLAALAVVWSERAGLSRGSFPIPNSIHLFGAPVIWRGLGLGRVATLLLSALLIGIVAGTLARRRLTTGLGDESDAELGARRAFAVGALLLLGCFLAGTSFAYRWIFSLWLVPWLWCRATGDSRSKVAAVALGLVFLSVWEDGLYCLALNFWLHRVPPVLDRTWHYFSHLVHWTLLTLLAGWLLEAAAQRLRLLARKDPIAGENVLSQ